MDSINFRNLSRARTRKFYPRNLWVSQRTRHGHGRGKHDFPLPSCFVETLKPDLVRNINWKSTTSFHLPFEHLRLNPSSFVFLYIRRYLLWLSKRSNSILFQENLLCLVPINFIARLFIYNNPRRPQGLCFHSQDIFFVRVYIPRLRATPSLFAPQLENALIIVDNVAILNPPSTFCSLTTWACWYCSPIRIPFATLLCFYWKDTLSSRNSGASYFVSPSGFFLNPTSILKLPVHLALSCNEVRERRSSYLCYTFFSSSSNQIMERILIFHTKSGLHITREDGFP